MTIEIPPSTYAELEGLIGSIESPVGIDAKKTHIIILHKLTQIEERLARLEARAIGADGADSRE
jgi:hypothetical protein